MKKPWRGTRVARPGGWRHLRAGLYQRRVRSIQDSHNDCWHDVDKLTQISLARAMQSLSLLSNTRGPHSNSSPHYAKGAGCKVPTPQAPLFQMGSRVRESLVEAGKGSGGGAPTLTPKASDSWGKNLLKVPLVLKPTACYFMARNPQRISPQRLRGFRHFALYFWFKYLKTIPQGLVSHRPPRGAF